MKKFFWFATGIAAGLAVAKQLAENPKAQAAVADAAQRARDLGAAVSEGFREREIELSKPAAKKSPSSKKPSAKKTAVKKPVVKKTTAKKSPSNKPAAK